MKTQKPVKTTENKLSQIFLKYQTGFKLLALQRNKKHLTKLDYFLAGRNRSSRNLLKTFRKLETLRKHLQNSENTQNQTQSLANFYTNLASETWDLAEIAALLLKARTECNPLDVTVRGRERAAELSIEYVSQLLELPETVKKLEHKQALLPQTRGRILSHTEPYLNEGTVEERPYRLLEHVYSMLSTRPATNEAEVFVHNSRNQPVKGLDAHTFTIPEADLHGIKVGILPKGIAGRLKHGVETAPYRLLNSRPEVLNTTFKIYSESALRIEHCLDIAENI